MIKRTWPLIAHTGCDGKRKGNNKTNMGAQFFKFKRFTVRHDLCAMKAGTDAVLLGSWCTACSHSRILDIGTGSGIIALMLAQRVQNSTITAIDNDVNAVKQAFININNSIFKESIEVQETDFRVFAKEAGNESFDSIVSNPPYFEEESFSPDKGRNTARHTSSLPFAELMHGSAALLKRRGTFSLIVPCTAARTVIVLAAAEGLYLSRRTDVSDGVKKMPVRSLLEFRKTNSPTAQSLLYIHNNGGAYSDDFKELTKEFYLNF